MQPLSNPPTADATKPKPFDRVCAPLLALLLLTGFCDYHLWGLSLGGLSPTVTTNSIFQTVSWILLIAALVLDDEGRFLPRVGLTLALFLLWIAAAETLRTFATYANNSQDIWHLLWSYRVWPQWILCLYLATASLTPKPSSSASTAARNLTVLLLLFAAWQLAATWASTNPEKSISIYRREMGRYLLALLVTIRLWARGGTPSLKWPAWAAAAAATAQIIAAIAMILIAHKADAADPELFAHLKAVEFIKQEGNAPTWRLWFPMADHNRLGAAMMANFCILSLAFALLKTSRLKWLLPPLLLAALTTAAYSLTRGAVVCIIISALPLLAIRLRKRALLAALGALLLVPFLIPKEKIEHLKTTFSVETWKNPHGSISLRLKGYHGALLMIQDSPLSGIGYSTAVFKEVYLTSYRQQTGDPEKKPHSHNVFLEYAAESGLPALAFYLLLTLYRWSLLWRAFRRAPRDALLLILIGYELATLIFNQFFFMYKGNQGLLLWTLLIVSTLYCIEIMEKRTASAPDRQGLEA